MQETDNVKTIGIYLGSAIGNNPEFEKGVIQFAKGLAKLEYTLVYGGASIGLMGVLAETMKQAGGKVIGIITEHLLEKEIGFEQADEIHIVQSMYERKRLIHEKSSRFIAFPGGLGTFDELFETWCGIKIGLIPKSIGFVNIGGFFDPLFQFLKNCEHEGFFSKKQLMIPSVYSNVSECLEDLAVDCRVLSEV